MRRTQETGESSAGNPALPPSLWRSPLFFPKNPTPYFLFSLIPPTLWLSYDFGVHQNSRSGLRRVGYIPYLHLQSNDFLFLVLLDYYQPWGLPPCDDISVLATQSEDSELSSFLFFCMLFFIYNNYCSFWAGGGRGGRAAGGRARAGGRAGGAGRR